MAETEMPPYTNGVWLFAFIVGLIADVAGVIVSILLIVWAAQEGADAQQQIMKSMLGCWIPQLVLFVCFGCQFGRLPCDCSSSLVTFLNVEMALVCQLIYTGSGPVNAGLEPNAKTKSDLDMAGLILALIGFCMELARDVHKEKEQELKGGQEMQPLDTDRLVTGWCATILGFCVDAGGIIVSLLLMLEANKEGTEARHHMFKATATYCVLLIVGFCFFAGIYRTAPCKFTLTSWLTWLNVEWALVAQLIYTGSGPVNAGLEPNQKTKSDLDLAGIILAIMGTFFQVLRDMSKNQN